MVQHYVPSPISPLSNTQIGPSRCLLVGRSDEIMVEFVNNDGEISDRAPKDGELAASKQLTWWASNANPLRTSRPVTRADGLKVTGWLTASLQGAYWIAVEVDDAKGRTLPVPSIIPRWADAAAFFDALLTLHTKGLFEAAVGGTLFLDEIGDMPLAMQQKLLRVLQEKVMRRVGETVERPVDVRVICATWHDLPALVKEGRFRRDLFYRLAAGRLYMPPLRDRRADIPSILASITGMTPELIKVFASHPCAWPGHVRELTALARLAVEASMTPDEARALLPPPSEVAPPRAPRAERQEVVFGQARRPEGGQHAEVARYLSIFASNASRILTKMVALGVIGSVRRGVSSYLITFSSSFSSNIHKYASDTFSDNHLSVSHINILNYRDKNASGLKKTPSYLFIISSLSLHFYQHPLYQTWRTIKVTQVKCKIIKDKIIFHVTFIYFGTDLQTQIFRADLTALTLWS